MTPHNQAVLLFLNMRKKKLAIATSKCANSLKAAVDDGMAVPAQRLGFPSHARQGKFHPVPIPAGRNPSLQLPSSCIGRSKGWFLPKKLPSIRQVVQQRFSTDRSITAALLRMHFYDCFVGGCDASILIDSTSQKQSQKDAGPNQTVRGYELIDEAKKATEAAFPSTVSCADIITLATRDAVALSGGPSYAMPTGRLDGLVSDVKDVNLPGPTFPVSQAFQIFQAKGLTLNDMVTLLGAHNVGVAHCSFFSDRLSNFQGTERPDPTMDSTLASMLNSCEERTVATGFSMPFPLLVVIAVENTFCGGKFQKFEEEMLDWLSTTGFPS